MEIAQRYFELRKIKDEIEKNLKDINADLMEAEKILVMEMENQNMQSFKDATHGTIYLRQAVYARLDDPNAAFQWFKENGLEDSWKYTIHNKTLCATVKEHPDIPGVVTSYETKVGYRKN